MLHAALLVLHLHAAVQQRINVSQSAYSEPHYIQFSFLCLFQLPSPPLWRSHTSLSLQSVCRSGSRVTCKCRSRAQSGRPRDAGTD